MRKIVIAATAALALGGASAPAQAGDGAAIAAGVIGGLAIGGLVAAAAQPVYRPVYYPTYGRPVYYRAAAPCWFERRRSMDDFGNVYFRRVRVCG